MQNSAICNLYSGGPSTETPSFSKELRSMNQFGLSTQTLNSERSMQNNGSIVPLPVSTSNANTVTENQGLMTKMNYLI